MHSSFITRTKLILTFAAWADLPQRGLHGGLLRVRVEHLASESQNLCGEQTAVDISGQETGLLTYVLCIGQENGILIST